MMHFGVKLILTLFLNTELTLFENTVNPDHLKPSDQDTHCFPIRLKFACLQMARGYKTFSHKTQLSTKCILLINVKMPTIVGILTFISMINTTSEILKARNFICRHFCFYEQFKSHA